MLIEVQNLSHTFAAGTPIRREALRDVSFRIEAGERVGIAGPTGSGKSTLVQHLAGLLKPTSGRVLLDRTPVHRGTPAARARLRHLGVAFQYPEDQIFERTVFREVAFGPRNLGLRDGELAARVRWALATVGLDPDSMGSRLPFTLSGGEMRRVALASTLALHPHVLILDEPTAGLDPQGQRDLLEHVAAWHARDRRTLIMVSHDLDVLARTVDRVIVLGDGRIVAAGPVRTVLSSTETLHAVGLEPLPAVVLLQQLRTAGALVRTDRFLPEEAATEIARVIAASKQTRGSSGESP